MDGVKLCLGWTGSVVSLAYLSGNVWKFIRLFVHFGHLTNPEKSNELVQQTAKTDAYIHNLCCDRKADSFSVCARLLSLYAMEDLLKTRVWALWYASLRLQDKCKLPKEEK